MSILLDEKHGVNPGMENCFVCNEPRGVILYGKLRGKTRQALNESGISTPDGEAPRNVVIDREPCDKCKGYMELGIILISVRDPQDEEEEANPYRTGGWVVVKEDVIRRAMNPEELVETILKQRIAFVPDDAWDMIGLPRGEEKQNDGTSTPGQ